jgi:hypothetical protein
LVRVIFEKPSSLQDTTKPPRWKPRRYIKIWFNLMAEKKAGGRGLEGQRLE